MSVIGKNPNLSVNGIRPARTLLPKYRQVIGDCSYLFPQPFTLEWTVAGDAAARTITLPLVSGYNYNFVINWDDGTTPSLVTAYNDANRIHTYASDGTYITRIYGVMEGWSFNDGGDKTKITKVVHWGSYPVFEGFKYLKAGFYGCSNLTQAGTGPIPASGTGITDFSNVFRDCTSLTSIPSGLFDSLVNVTNISGLFYNCTGLTSIPSGLFDNNTSVSGNVASVFYNCSGIASIPSGLLDSLSGITNANFFFARCYSLTSIPSGLLDTWTNVTNLNVFFQYCTSLVSIPSGLFDNCTNVTSMQGCFAYCNSLETISDNLCRLLTSCLNFSNMFYGCNKLQQNPTTFYAAGEQSTRFLNQSPDFESCFERNSFTGTQGTASDLWNCSFGTGTPTTTDCWAGAGNSAASLTNYASIPSAWGGPA